MPNSEVDQAKKTDLPEEPLSSDLVYTGSFLTMQRDQVRLQNGVIATREYIKHPGAVMIIPLFETGQQHFLASDGNKESIKDLKASTALPDPEQTMLSRHVLIERQYRYAVQEQIIEFPAGKLDPHESSLACAKRELHEETGYAAEQWHYLTRIYPCISYSTEWIDIYLAQGLTPGTPHMDEEEYLEVESIPLAQLLDWVKCGKIRDVKTLIGAFWLEKIILGKWDGQPA
jgi:ADP-ribose pyrophosphatase